jgi:maltose O-acetyltransferase
MLAGDLYIADDPELARDSLRAMRLMAKFNQGAADSPAERRRILKELLGAIGEDTEIRPPLYCAHRRRTPEQEAHSLIHGASRRARD